MSQILPTFAEDNFGDSNNSDSSYSHEEKFYQQQLREEQEKQGAKSEGVVVNALSMHPLGKKKYKTKIKKRIRCPIGGCREGYPSKVQLNLHQAHYLFHVDTRSEGDDDVVDLNEELQELTRSVASRVDFKEPSKTPIGPKFAKNERVQMFQCGICGSQLDSKYNFKVHMRAHASFRCDVCFRVYTQENSLLIHKQVVHSGLTELHCGICDKHFAYNSSLNKHVLVHSQEKAYKCFVCSKRYSLHGELNFHLKQHKEEEMRAAESQNQPGNSSHQENVQQINSTNSQKANKVTPKHNNDSDEDFEQQLASKTLKQHQQQQQKQQSYRTRGSLKGNSEQKQVPQNIDRKQIEIQDAENSDSVKEDQRAVDYLSPISLTNEQSDYEFDIEDNPRASTAAGTGTSKHTRGNGQQSSKNSGQKKNHYCNKCNKHFNNSSHLKRHIYDIHENRRPFECPVCGQKFKRSGHLKEHSHRHTKESGIDQAVLQAIKNGSIRASKNNKTAALQQAQPIQAQIIESPLPIAATAAAPPPPPPASVVAKIITAPAEPQRDTEQTETIL